MGSSLNEDPAVTNIFSVPWHFVIAGFHCTKDIEYGKLWPAIQMYKKAFLATTDCELWTFTLQYNTGNLIHTILLWNSIFHVECTTLQVIATCSVSSLCGLVSTLIFGLH